MKNFVHKIDNNPTSAGVVTADEYNSFLSELKNAAGIYKPLSEGNSSQLRESMYLSSRDVFYQAAGSANQIILTRSSVSVQQSALVDNMTIFFQAKYANTGVVTLKLEGSPTMPARFKGSEIPPGGFEAGGKYIAVLDSEAGEWDCDVLTTGGKYYTKDMTHQIVRQYGVPAGTIIALAGIPPADDPWTKELKENYIFCDGSMLESDRFPALYKCIGTTYGEVGDTTPVLFLIPDLKIFDGCVNRTRFMTALESCVLCIIV
jgi:hypothetical protein